MIASIYAPTLWIEFANLEKMRRRGAEGGSVVLMNGRVAERVQPQLEQMGKWAVVALKWAALGNVERPLIWPAKHLRGGGGSRIQPQLVCKSHLQCLHACTQHPAPVCVLCQASINPLRRPQRLSPGPGNEPHWAKSAYLLVLRPLQHCRPVAYRFLSPVGLLTLLLLCKLCIHLLTRSPAHPRLSATSGC
jgi:hypothetical protein